MRLATLIASIGLLGCAGETYYKKPDTAQLARVRFAGSGTAHTGILVTQHESENCELGKSGGIMGVVGGIAAGAPMPLGNVPPHVDVTGNSEQMIGFGEALGTAPIERTIPADRDFVFTIRRKVDTWATMGLGTTWTCTVTRQFTPRPGAEYEVVYSETAVNEKTGTPTCGVRLARLERTKTGAVQRVVEKSFRVARQTCSPGSGNTLPR